MLELGQGFLKMSEIYLEGQIDIYDAKDFTRITLIKSIIIFSFENFLILLV